MNRYGLTYNNPKSCWYDECYFHSLLELRFALMKENDFLYIREPVIIPYDRHTLSLPKSKWHPVNFYVPDFLLIQKIGSDAI